MKIFDTVKLNKSVYKNLPEIDQLIIDLNLNKNKEYAIESIEQDGSTEILYFYGVLNIGFDSKWFDIEVLYLKK